MFKNHINKFKFERGSAYVSLIISLVVIEFVALTLLSAVVVANQANIKSTKTIIAYRIAESSMEKAISCAKMNFNNVVNCKTTENINNEYIVTVTPVPDNGYLNRIQVTVDFSLGSLDGKKVPEKVSLESLVGRR